MKKIKIEKPSVVAQSNTEPILWGGYQDPHILCDDGVIYVRFNGRRDCPETMGYEDKNPVFLSRDMGKTWEKSEHRSWILAHPKLPNGDRLIMREHKIIKNPENLPEFPINREKTKSAKKASIAFGLAYKVDELEKEYGESVAKVFLAERIRSGESEPVEEYCKVNWKNMPVHYNNDYLWRVIPTCKYKIDSENVMWMPVYGGSISDDGTMNSKRLCTHLLRSDDYGHTWEYVSTVIYKEEYNPPEATDFVEGFDETALEILDDGSIIMIMRSGSMYPRFKETDPTNYPIPKCYFAKSTDHGKTWSEVKPFYDYGIRPGSVKLGDGVIIMIAGRPGVYVRATYDKNAEIWEDPVEVVAVPEDKKYDAYYEYTCCNADICAYDDKTAFIAYSDFQITDSENKRAKTILVSKITVENI